MKKILLFLLLGISLQVSAATSITTSAVSGHWTLAGSPYDIYNDISVLANTTLKIDPGVQVVFHGLYRLSVSGTLQAVGTPSMRVSFRASDTTGWSDDGNPLGGWRGIQFNDFASTGVDSTAFEYCNVTDMKYGSSSTTYPGYNTGCFFIDTGRHLVIKNCNFYHNLAQNGYARCMILYGNQTLDSCNIYDNRGGMILLMSLATPVINHCSVYHNTAQHVLAASLLYMGVFHNVKILNCDIYENTTGMQGSQVFVDNGHALIQGCKIHHNTNPDEGAIYCVGGQTEITGNLICNNRQTNPASCGAVEGGGAMHLCFNISVSSWDSTFFIVRNNIIANNYSASGYGTGVYVWHARAWIMNNTIINNTGASEGAAIGLINAGSSTYIKNNIIYNNQPTFAGTAAQVWILNADSVRFEYNWMQRPFAQTVTGGSYTLIGDTSTNVIGTDPLLVDPTDTASVTESAIGKNFALTSTSGCIDHGINTGCWAYTTDYAGLPRIASGTIDIGAHEYQNEGAPAGTHLATAAPPQMAVHPNPASGSTIITLPLADGILKIADATGRVVSVTNVTAPNVSVEVANYPKGLYTIEWYAANGSAHVQKLIVE